MAALPADIAKYTNDGVVLTYENGALRVAHPEAEDRLDQPVEMFFDNAADGAPFLLERLAIQSALNPIHEGIELDDTIGLGHDIPLAPNVPAFRLVDERTGVDTLVRLRAFAYEAGEDRFTMEVIE